MSNDLPSIRRTNLANWFETRSIPSKEKSYISQLIRGSASFGEKAARRLERDYQMPHKYLDQGFDQAANLGFGGIAAPPGSRGLLDNPLDVESAIAEISKQSPAKAAELQAELLMLKAKILRQAEELGQHKPNKTPKDKAA